MPTEWAGSGGPGRAGAGPGRGGGAGGPGAGRAGPGAGLAGAGAGAGAGRPRSGIETGTIFDTALTISKTLVAAVQPGVGVVPT